MAQSNVRLTVSANQVLPAVRVDPAHLLGQGKATALDELVPGLLIEIVLRHDVGEGSVNDRVTVDQRAVEIEDDRPAGLISFSVRGRCEDGFRVACQTSSTSSGNEPLASDAAAA